MSGQTKTITISEELLEAYESWQEVEKDSKIEVALDFAALFCDEHDFSDESKPDEYHAILEEYSRAQMEFEMASLRVSRLASKMLAAILKGANTSVRDILSPKETTN